jgi:DNA polymerase III alpha subunit
MDKKLKKKSPKSLSEDQLLKALYNGIKPSKLYLNDEIIKEYEKWQDDLDLPLVNTHVYDGRYLMPCEYYNLDISKYVRSLCKSDEELNRVNDELMLFELAGEIDFIKYMKYLVDTMNSMNLVWGVGRGSSISVYIFYLLGVHKVDCIKYNVSYDEFFKIKE